MRSYVDIVEVLSYETLRGGTTMGPLKHGYLSKSRILNANQTMSILYSVTDKLKRLTQQQQTVTTNPTTTAPPKPILLVIDEFHKTKNDSLQGRACGALIRHFLHEANQRLLFLSATPFDHVRHMINFYKLMGIITHRSLCTRNRSTEGFYELISFCESIDEKTTHQLVDPYRFQNLNVKTTENLSLKLWSQVIAPTHVFAMSSKSMFTEFGEEKNVKNLHCPIDTEQFTEGIRRLKMAIHYGDDRVGGYHYRNIHRQDEKRSFAQINQALIMIEKSKVPILIQLIKQDLFFYPNCKIIVLCSYRDTIQQLHEALCAKTNTLRFEGGMDRNEEKNVIRLFQSPSLKHRLFLANFSKGELGISLHDTFGNRPRRMYIIPSYKNPHQAVGRVYRSGLRSNPTVRFIYGRERTETKIMDALARMKVVMLETLPQQKADQMIFPGEYESISLDEIPAEIKIFLEYTHQLFILQVIWKESQQDYSAFFATGIHQKETCFIWYQNEQVTASSCCMDLFPKMTRECRNKFQQQLDTFQASFPSQIFPRDLISIISHYHDLDMGWYFF